MLSELRNGTYSFLFCVKKVLWLLRFRKNVSKLLKVDTMTKMIDITLGGDSQGLISNGHNKNMTELNREKDPKYLLSADHIRCGIMQLKYVPSIKTVAGVLTKNLHFQ